MALLQLSSDFNYTITDDQVVMDWSPYWISSFSPIYGHFWWILKASVCKIVKKGSKIEGKPKPITIIFIRKRNFGRKWKSGIHQQERFCSKIKRNIYPMKLLLYGIPGEIKHYAKRLLLNYAKRLLLNGIYGSVALLWHNALKCCVKVKQHYLYIVWVKNSILALPYCLK